MSEIRHYNYDEEGQVFTEMRRAMDPADLRKLGSRVEVFKKLAPTRPHLNLPDQPFAQAAAGSAASLFDGRRELATGRGTDD